jgi:hypothetical protein
MMHKIATSESLVNTDFLRIELHTKISELFHSILYFQCNQVINLFASV